MRAVGIDLGTTNSAIALEGDGGAIVLAPTSEGARLLPSAVLVGPEKVAVGEGALRDGPATPGRFFQHWKRDLGDLTWSRQLDGKTWTPVLLSSLVLRTLLESARSFAGETVREAVVTVPAYFGDLERGATLDAARIAGLEKARCLNEPTAAAIAFGLDPGARSRGIDVALCYDLGGGTFDVTVVALGNGTVRVLATAGEHRLGGKDWDDELLNLVAERVYEETGQDPREDDALVTELRALVESAKHDLTDRAETLVRVPLPVGKTHAVAVTRDAFEARTRGLLEQTATQLAIVLDKAKLRWSDVHAVLPVGGATRMPMVQRLLARLAGREPQRLLDPDEAVARGACAYARLLARGGHVDEVVPEESRRLRPESDVIALLPGAAGARTKETSSESAVELDSEEMPLLPGLVRRVPEVSDVVSHGLGVLLTTKGGFRNFVLIPEQTPVPVERRKVFRTVRADQTKVQVKVLEGEASDPEECIVLGTVTVEGLPAGRPKGQRIEVSYRYDEDGRVQVSARDVASGKAARATFERRGALRASEIKELRTRVATALDARRGVAS